MSWLQVIVLSIVQGLTEFLPVSSSGHLAIVSQLFFSDDAGASFTAVTQLGTELAVLIYFARDIGRIIVAWFAGLTNAARRTSDYWLGWWVIIGTLPICVLGLAFKDQIRSGVRNLWIVAIALIAFSAVIAAAEYFSKKTRPIEQFTWKDAVTVGLAQCLALVPGVSRSGATISAGLFLGQQREAAALGVWVFLATEVMTGGPQGLFYGGGFTQLGKQALGAVVVGAYAFAVSYALAKVIDRFMGFRVSAEDETTGVDFTQHAETAYAEGVHGHQPARRPSSFGHLGDLSAQGPRPEKAEDG